ncbi:MAG: macro domain-containing protein [Nitrospirota bacterium]
MEIEVIKGSIMEAEAEAIVNPANSHGWMGGGVAGVIKRGAGKEAEKEAVAQAPIPVGGACLTSGGKSKFKWIIHAPTMFNPAEKIPAANVGLAAKAAVNLADDKGIVSLAVPGMGTGVGGVKPMDAAKAMIKEIRGYQAKSLKKVILIDINDGMIEAWKRELSLT